MSISALTSDSLGTLIGEYGPKYMGKGINSKCVLLKSGKLKKVEPDGREYTVTLYPTAHHSTGFVLDNGRLPKGGSGAPLLAREMPAVLVSRLEQGRAASKMKISPHDRIRALDKEMKVRASDCGRIMNRAIIGGSQVPQATASWSGTAADSTVTISFLDITLFREGMAVDFVDTSLALAYVVRVKAVTPAAVGSNSANVAGTVEFINDVVNPATDAVVALGAVAVAVDDVFRIRGATAGFGASSTLTGALCNSFDDIAGAGATSTFMGQNPASMGIGYNWRGNSRSLGAAYSQEAMMAFAAHIGTVSEESPDVAVCHTQVAAAHAASGDYHGAAFGVSAGLSAARTRTIEQSVDKYGNVYKSSGLQMAGAEVVKDDSVTADRIIFFNTEFTKLAVWSEMSPDEEGGSAELLGRTYYNKEVQFSGLFNLVTDERSTVGVLSGITGL